MTHLSGVRAIILLALLLSVHARADPADDGRLGNRSQGAVMLTLELLPLARDGLHFIAGTEVVSDLLPEFLASSLLASRRVSFGVCPPGIYDDGFAVAVPAAGGFADDMNDWVSTPIEVRVGVHSEPQSRSAGRALTVTACTGAPGSEVLISLQTAGGLFVPRVLIGKLLLLIKPE